MPETPPTYTQAELNTLCAEWQKLLRLQQWDIVVKIVRGKQLDNHSRAGQIGYSHTHVNAIIEILDPVDYEPDHEWEGDFPVDMEQTLVHELLELHFGPFKEDEGEKYRAQEVAINMISGALVALKRSK